MSTLESTRRDFLRAMGVGATTGIVVASAPADAATPSLKIDPEPQYDLSPYLYMQFMEPLGTTDGSVAAAWDFGHDRWRERNWGAVYLVVIVVRNGKFPSHWTRSSNLWQTLDAFCG